MLEDKAKKYIILDTLVLVLCIVGLITNCVIQGSILATLIYIINIVFLIRLIIKGIKEYICIIRSKEMYNKVTEELFGKDSEYIHKKI